MRLNRPRPSCIQSFDDTITFFIDIKNLIMMSKVRGLLADLKWACGQPNGQGKRKILQSL